MKAASSLFEWLQGFFINLLDTDKFLIKSLHIVTYFIIGNAGVNLRGFYIGVSQHFADRFDGNTLCKRGCSRECVPGGVSNI